MKLATLFFPTVLLTALACACVQSLDTAIPEVVSPSILTTTQLPTIHRSPNSIPGSPTPVASLTVHDSPTPVPSPLFTIYRLPFTASPTLEPFGCLTPPEDYTRVEVNGWVLNRRTLAMLEHAAQLYGGELEITGYHITQGSYHDNGAASFGTHLGGGAVDLSVMRKGTYTVLWEDVDPLLAALRTAGFAAWLREYGELSPDSPIHIHAIAIGDAELSQAAQDQLTGPFGYFRGFSGVPVPDGTPELDRYGGPVLCPWLIEMGYSGE